MRLAALSDDALVPPVLALLANLAVGVLLIVVSSSPRITNVPGRRSAALAALPLLTAAVLGVYVSGEDSYRGNGISRWDAYRSPGGALGSMFLLSVGLMVACAAGLAYAGLGAKVRLFRVVAFAGGLTSLTLLTATIVGFSAN